VDSPTSHAVVVETLAELVTDDEEHGLGIRQFLRIAIEGL